MSAVAFFGMALSLEAWASRSGGGGREQLGAGPRSGALRSQACATTTVPQSWRNGLGLCTQAMKWPTWRT